MPGKVGTAGMSPSQLCLGISGAAMGEGFCSTLLRLRPHSKQAQEIPRRSSVQPRSDPVSAEAARRPWATGAAEPRCAFTF